MTIQGIIEKIKEFNLLVITSGLERDINGYITSFSQPQNQTNLSLHKDIVEKMINLLQPIYTESFINTLKPLFPKPEIKPLTTTNYLQKFKELQINTTLNASQYFTHLRTLLTQLKALVDSNKTHLQALEVQLSPFISNKELKSLEEKSAVISIDFKNETTIGSLKKFSDSLKNWDRTLYVYHQIISSESPKDIKLIDIEDGSIDILISINFDIANNLLELFAAGLSAFTAYLVLKNQRSEFAKSYNGNQKLIKLDKEYEKELMNNIESTILECLKQQHAIKLESDMNLKSESIDAKYSEVTKLIKEHIVNGNEIRLISTSEDATSKEIKVVDENVKTFSKTVKNELKKLPKEEIIKMIEEFINDDKGTK